MHQNLVVNSAKQNSAQSNVFYVKKKGDDKEEEYILKIYQGKELLSYENEKLVFN
jgi:hypothetical protein